MTTRDILAEIIGAKFGGYDDEGIADAILADRRIAVVELPEPHAAALDVKGIWFAEFTVQADPVADAEGRAGVSLFTGTALHRRRARVVAAALLAAANAIEESA